MKARVTTLFLLAFSGAMFAQANIPDQQQEDFKNACFAGALKAEGCPKLQLQDPNRQIVIPQNLIPPADHSLDHALDKPVETFTLPKVAPTSTLPTTAEPAPKPDIELQPAPEPQTKPTAGHPIIPSAKSGAHQTADCGPATAPPGAGALYGVNHAMCLRRAARQR